MECNSLTKITIPASVSTVGDYAFYECPITQIYCYAMTPPECNRGEDIFTVYLPSATLYVPKESVNIYKLSVPWGWFTIEGLDMESGASIVLGEEDNYYRVYDLTGHNILNTSDHSEIGNLPKGIYIVNGKKETIK